MEVYVEVVVWVINTRVSFLTWCGCRILATLALETSGHCSAADVLVLVIDHGYQ